MRACSPPVQRMPSRGSWECKCALARSMPVAPPMLGFLRYSLRSPSYSAASRVLGHGKFIEMLPGPNQRVCVRVPRGDTFPRSPGGSPGSSLYLSFYFFSPIFWDSFLGSFVRRPRCPRCCRPFVLVVVVFRCCCTAIERPGLEDGGMKNVIMIVVLA